MKKSTKTLIALGLMVLAGLFIYFYKFKYEAYFPSCNLVYASYLDCANYPDVGNCGKQTSVTCGLTFLGDVPSGATQVSKCDFGYGTPLGWQSEKVLNYGETYSFFAYNGKIWYIFGYYCPLTTTTSSLTTTQPVPTTTTTTIGLTCASFGYNSIKPICLSGYESQSVTTPIGVCWTNCQPVGPDMTIYIIIALLIIIPLVLLVVYFAIRR